MKMFTTIAFAALAALTACGEYQPKTESMTRRETCARLIKAQDDAQHFRGRGLPGPYGVARKMAEYDVTEYSKHCDDRAMTAYLKELAQ